MNTINFEYLKEQYGDSSVYEAVKEAQSFYGEFPTKPNPPQTLSRNHDAKDLEEYTVAFKKYEADYKDWAKKSDEYRVNYQKINEAIEEYIKWAAGLHQVPEKYRVKLWTKAWEDGHSSGYSEVFGCLASLVYIFED